MAGVTERRAMKLHDQGAAYARHLKVEPGSERYRAIVYGTKRAGGWRPSGERETRIGTLMRRRER